MSMNAVVKTFTDPAHTVLLPGPLGRGLIDWIQKPGREAKQAQENLERQRQAQLAGEAATRNTAKKKAAGTGQHFGFLSPGVSSFLGGFGFGSGNTAPGATRGNLFGN